MWCNSELDLSVSKINASGLNYVKFGDSSKIKSGETVYAIGNPIGYEFRRTITSGIISAINRTIKIEENNSVSYMTDLIQTDASINPGNSGGPLLNINGEVIGVTSMKLVEDEIEGMGFAIPIELVSASLSDLEQGKEIERPLFGAQLFDADKAYYLRNYNIDINQDIKEGTIIVKLEDNSPASKSGLQIGDVITKVDDKKVENTAHFRYLLYKHHILLCLPHFERDSDIQDKYFLNQLYPSKDLLPYNYLVNYLNHY